MFEVAVRPLMIMVLMLAMVLQPIWWRWYPLSYVTTSSGREREWEDVTEMMRNIKYHFVVIVGFWFVGNVDGVWRQHWLHMGTTCFTTCIFVCWLGSLCVPDVQRVLRTHCWLRDERQATDVNWRTIWKIFLYFSIRVATLVRLWTINKAFFWVRCLISFLYGMFLISSSKENLGLQVFLYAENSIFNAIDRSPVITWLKKYILRLVKIPIKNSLKWQSYLKHFHLLSCPPPSSVRYAVVLHFPMECWQTIFPFQFASFSQFLWRVSFFSSSSQNCPFFLCHTTPGHTERIIRFIVDLKFMTILLLNVTPVLYSWIQENVKLHLTTHLSVCVCVRVLCVAVSYCSAEIFLFPNTSLGQHYASSVFFFLQLSCGELKFTAILSTDSWWKL